MRGFVRLRVVIGLLAIVLCGLLGLIALDYQRFLQTPVATGLESFEIPQGTNLTRVANRLENQGVIDNATYLRVYARWREVESAIQAGEYALEVGQTPVQLLEKFVQGDVRLHPFTIIEGWNRWELLEALASDDTLLSTLTETGWPAFLAELESDYANPEGLFLPETYLLPRGSTDKDLLRQAFTSMRRALEEEWQQRSDDAVVKTPYEALILASIIEKETARVDERTRIAGVFTRRLNIRMRLQTDPTVIYGLLPDFNGDLTRKNMRTDTAYNTYTRGGLPPTPISMPGRAAIRAALNPADGTELYFVASGLSDGSHVFSDTLEDHQSAVQDYLRRLRQTNSSP